MIFDLLQTLLALTPQKPKITVYTPYHRTYFNLTRKYGKPIAIGRERRRNMKVGITSRSEQYRRNV